jgi:hypothetical protein
MVRKQIRRPFRAQGVWQRPNDARRLPGTLTISRSGGLSVRLIVDDTAAPRPASGPIGIDPEDLGSVVMVGETSDGRRYTLWDGFFRRGNPWSRIFRTVGYKELRFNRGIEGICEAQPKELRFSEANIRIDILPAWLGRNNFGVSPQRIGEETWAPLQCANRTALGFEIGEGRELSFGWTVRGPAMRLAQTTATIAIRPILTIKYSTPVPLTTCEADLTVITNLLQLLSGCAVTYHNLCLSSPPAEADVSDGRTSQDTVRVLGSRLKSAKTGLSFGPQSFLFGLPSIETRFGELLRSWWQLYRANEHALRTYFSVNRWSRSFVDERFFVMASTAEAVHNIVHPNASLLQPQEWKKVLQALRQAIPDEHRAKLLPKLSHLPGPTFAERIASLISDLPDELRHRVIGDTEQQTRFVRRVKTLRNARAHQLEDRASGVEFVKLLSKLRVLIDWALLQALGFEPGEIVAAINGCPEYGFYAYAQTWPWEQ